jgi:hypothetical protein
VTSLVFTRPSDAQIAGVTEAMMIPPEGREL